MLALKVKADGTLTVDPALDIPNRFQALLQKKKNEGVSARERNLQTIAEEMLELGGPGEYFACMKILRVWCSSRVFLFTLCFFFLRH